MKKMVIILIILVTLGFVWYRYIKSSDEENGIKEVVVRNPARTAIVDRIAADGVVEIKNRQALFISKAQRVDKVLFTEGDEVSRGELLIIFDETERDEILRQIDMKNMDIENEKLSLEELEFPLSELNILNQKRAIEELEASLLRTKNRIKIIEWEKEIIARDIKNREKDFEVQKKLYEIQGTSYREYLEAEEAVKRLEENLKRKNFDIAELELDISEIQSKIELAKVRLADEEKALEQKEISTEISKKRAENRIKRMELELKTLKLDLDKTVIELKSPVSGTIVELNAEENLRAGLEKPLVVVADINSQIIKADILSYDISKVRVGQNVRITSEALPGERAITGKVSRVSSMANVQSGSGFSDIVVEVEIEFDSKNSNLRPGYNVNLEIIVNRKEDVITIPSFAVQSQRGEDFVLVVGDNNVIERKNIEKGIQTVTMIEVYNMSETDKIVMNPMAVKEGETVKIIERIESSVPAVNNDTQDIPVPGARGGGGGGRGM